LLGVLCFANEAEPCHSAVRTRRQRDLHPNDAFTKAATNLFVVALVASVPVLANEDTIIGLVTGGFHTNNVVNSRDWATAMDLTTGPERVKSLGTSYATVPVIDSRAGRSLGSIIRAGRGDIQNANIRLFQNLDLCNKGSFVTDNRGGGSP
jgi:hypothetical protein